MTKIPNLTDELREAYNSLVMAQDKYKAIKQELEPLEHKILIDFKLKIADEFIGEGRTKHPKGSLVTREFDVYLADDDDAIEYYKLCHALYIKRGYKVEEFYSPTLIAHSEVLKAQNRFIDESTYLTDKQITRDDLTIVKHRKEYLKLTLDLVSKIIKNEEEHLSNLFGLIKEVSTTKKKYNKVRGY